MRDLTIVFLTTNKLPIEWARYHKESVMEAIGDTKVISLSCKPIDFGTNIIQTEKITKSNIFYQMLRGVKIVDTEFFAIVEDDTLYPKDHFELRPPVDKFAYNQNRWSLYTWDPVYNLKNYIRTNATLIAPTQLALESLEERFKKYPHNMKDIPKEMSGELGYFEKELGVTLRKTVELKSDNSVVQIDHDYFTVFDDRKESVERRHRKSLGKIKANVIPIWGSAEEIVKKFK